MSEGESSFFFLFLNLLPFGLAQLKAQMFWLQLIYFWFYAIQLNSSCSNNILWLVSHANHSLHTNIYAFMIHLDQLMYLYDNFSYIYICLPQVWSIGLSLLVGIQFNCYALLTKIFGCTNVWPEHFAQ